jgi:serine/threonine protein kinase
VKASRVPFHVLTAISDRHIDSLSQLTGESADAVRSWFSQLLKQGMGGSPSDSAYKSQTALAQRNEPFWHDPTCSTELVQAPPLQLSTPEVTSNSIQKSTSTVVQLAASLRGTKKQRCTPTDDLELLGRDPRKIYQCTRKCGKRYGRKNDWKRNEEEGYPCKSWVCSLCTTEGVENVKPCYRKYHFAQHFRNIHPGVNAENYDETSVVYSETEFPRKCGFCRHRFESRQERIDHIADHFKQGKCMLHWRDEDSDSSGSDGGDDDDDRPSGDGFDGNSSSPPGSDPRGGSNSKYFSSGGSSSSSSSQQHSGGFFQFQLSQSGESQLYCAVQPIKPTTLSPSTSQSSISAESDSRASLGLSTEQRSLHGRHTPTEEHNKAVLAGDALAHPVKSIHDSSRLDQKTEERLVEHPYWKRAGVSIEANTLQSTGASSATKTTPVQQELLVRDRKDQSPSVSVDEIAAIAVATDQQPLQITKTSQPFLSVKLLGSGGFSTVDEVVHRPTGLHIGRKTLKNRGKTAIEDLRKEVSVLQKLRHPHVIRFLGAYSNGDKMSILLSPIAETTLALWLERSAVKKPANLPEMIINMFGCLASSVRYLHEQRPVVKHMDIKPQNILIVEGDQEFPHIVLSDFGISSAEELSDDQTKPLTRHYIAPEVFQGFTRKQAADIWSLGCVFAEMASIPFRQGNTGWLTFRKEFSGRTGKYYWQDVPGLQERLAVLLEQATTATEQTVVRTLKAMLNAEPEKRPDAESLTMIFTPAPCCLNWPNDKATFPGPLEELSRVEMLVHEDGIDCHAQHTHDGSPGEANDVAPSAKTWLEDCAHNHEACSHLASSGASFLPTRLVDVLPDGQPGSFVRIVHKSSLESTSSRVDYVALSHVWSPSQPQLMSDSLSYMQAELPLQVLPEAVNAAISEAHRLGYRYLWTDSLCVVQDDMQEKELECNSMKDVFRNAALTVVLDQLTSEDVEGNAGISGTTDKTHLTSLLGAKPRAGQLSTDDQLQFNGRLQIAGQLPIDDQLQPNGRLPTNGQLPFVGRLPASAQLPTSVYAAPNFGWDTRAHALLNRLLSRRFLHLGEQLYWECNTLKASETFPRGLSPLVWEKVHTQCSEGIQSRVNEHRASSRMIQGSGRKDGTNVRRDSNQTSKATTIEKHGAKSEILLSAHPDSNTSGHAIQHQGRCAANGDLRLRTPVARKQEDSMIAANVQIDDLGEGQMGRNGQLGIGSVNGSGNGNGIAVGNRNENEDIGRRKVDVRANDHDRRSSVIAKERE